MPAGIELFEFGNDRHHSDLARVILPAREPKWCVYVLLTWDYQSTFSVARVCLCCCACGRARARACAFIHVSLSLSLHVYLHIHTHTCIHTHTRTYVHFSLSLLVHTSVYTYIAHMLQRELCVALLRTREVTQHVWFLYTCVCVFACIGVRVCVRARARALYVLSFDHIQLRCIKKSKQNHLTHMCSCMRRDFFWMDQVQNARKCGYKLD